MTKREFLDTMDKIKDELLLRKSNGYCLFTCNIISIITSNNINNQYQSKMRTSYEKIFDLDNMPTFQCFNKHSFKTRIAALELFEIISLEKKLYLKY